MQRKPCSVVRRLALQACAPTFLHACMLCTFRKLCIKVRSSNVVCMFACVYVQYICRYTCFLIVYVAWTCLNWRLACVYICLTVCICVCICICTCICICMCRCICIGTCTCTVHIEILHRDRECVCVSVGTCAHAANTCMPACIIHVAWCRPEDHVLVYWSEEPLSTLCRQPSNQVTWCLCLATNPNL